MITAAKLQKAQKEIEEAEQVVKQEMPNAEFVFIGLDEGCIYFRVIARLNKVTPQQIRDIKEKTRFATLEESKNGIYKAEFSVML